MEMFELLFASILLAPRASSSGAFWRLFSVGYAFVKRALEDVSSGKRRRNTTLARTIVLGVRSRYGQSRASESRLCEPSVDFPSFQKGAC